MPRPPGRRNADFSAARNDLLAGLHARLTQPDGASCSFRELASACGVSAATLRHYFDDRDGAVHAVLQRQHELGEGHRRALADAAVGPLADSVRAILAATVEGFTDGGLGRLHSLGLGAGLRHPSLGPAYLVEVLEPSLQVVEARLARHRDAGDLDDDVDLRHAALALLAPPLVLLLHQEPLGGGMLRPADVPAILDRHARAFVRAFRARRRRRRKQRQKGRARRG